MTVLVLNYSDFKNVNLSMDIMIKNVQEKHLLLINELAKSLDFEISEPAEDYLYVLDSAEQEAIEKGLADAEAGKLNSHAKAKKLYEKWL